MRVVQAGDAGGRSVVEALVEEVLQRRQKTGTVAHVDGMAVGAVLARAPHDQAEEFGKLDRDEKEETGGEQGEHDDREKEDQPALEELEDEGRGPDNDA